MATFDMLIYIILGVYLFHIDLSHINILSTGIIFILTIATFSSLGIISASFIMVFKRGNPISWLASNLEGLIGGVYFPITVLPAWGQFLAKLFPITYAIRALQLSVYQGYSPQQLKKEILALFLFTLILLPLSLSLFKHSIKIAKKNGSLAKY
ncbi:MAG: ABC transporter permease [Candidatus Omnitrophota bacterium]